MGIFSRVRQKATQDAVDAIPAPTTIADPSVTGEGRAGMPGERVAEVGAASPSPLEGFDGSKYGSWSGYLQAANEFNNKNILGAANEAEAKQRQQAFLESLVPELQKRGANVGRIKNEAITIDGREYDTIQDIGGKSAAQLLELGLPGAGPTMGAGMGSLASLLGGGGGSAAGSPGLDPAAQSNANLQRILAEIGAANSGPLQQQQVIAKTAKQDALRDRMERGA